MLSLLILLIFLFSIEVQCRTIVKHFEKEIDDKIGYWSPSTSSIDWCERNYVVTWYIAEFWNCLSSLVMCLFAGMLFVHGFTNRIEKRFLFLSLSFGLVGFGSAYFHGTLTHLGQMADEIPMVYSMIIWWFILFRMNHISNDFKRDKLILFGIFYGLLWTYVHSLQTFILVFQIHFVLMVLFGIVKLIWLYRLFPYRNNKTIKCLIKYYIGLIVIASICWLIDQQLCEELNHFRIGFNPQLHAWWHIFCAFDCHVGIICGQAMRLLATKYQQHRSSSSRNVFKPEEHLQIRFYFGLPFVNYSQAKKPNKTK